MTAQVEGTRGERLFAALCDVRSLGPAERVLAEEAGRLADRLDRLERHLQGRDWLRLAVVNLDLADTVVEVVVRVDQVLSETRQQQVALKQLVGELRQSAEPRRPGSSAAPVSSPGGPPGEAAGLGDLFDELAKRRRPASSP